MRILEIVVFLFIISIEIVRCARLTQIDRRCKLTIPDDIPRNEPIYLVQNRNNFTYYEPNGQMNYFGLNEHLHIFCPGKRNSIQIEHKIINGNLTDVTCLDGKFTSNVFEDVSSLSGVNCTRGVQTDIRISKQRCSSGHIIDVGFKLSNNVFLPRFKICFDNTTWSPLWSKHVINGKSIKFNVKESGRRQFKTTGLPLNSHPSDVYKNTAQINYFKDVIGETQTKKYFTTTYLARGHLTPDADFVFRSAQWSTYFYINTCPQFQKVNAGNWLRVESLARKLAQHYDVNMEIFTGVHDTLKLENSVGNSVDIYLTADGKFKVPKWIWKIIKNPETDAAIVMITLNDPFKSEQEVEEFCQNVCARAYVDSKHFKTMVKGYTFCCELLEFRRIVRTLPPDATAGKLLSCSNIILDE